jgi:hypothetical protein
MILEASQTYCNAAQGSCSYTLKADIGFWHLLHLQMDPVNGAIISVFRCKSSHQFLSNEYYWSLNFI